MIGVIDFGVGNLQSVQKAFEHLGARVSWIRTPQQMNSAAKLVLPGVGHFAATGALERTGLREAIEKAVAGGTPLLGICLGMQWLFEGSEEAPHVPGLSHLSGRCLPLPASVKSPHVGWNRIRVSRASRLLKDIGPDPFVYFSHSFAVSGTAEAVAITDYGFSFTAAVESKNLFGVQFHPEKSGATGLTILKNYCDL